MVTCVVFKAWSPGAVSVTRPGGRWFKSNPRHQGIKKAGQVGLPFLSKVEIMFSHQLMSGLIRCLCRSRVLAGMTYLNR